MKLGYCKFGTNETIHIHDKDSVTSGAALCGYSGYFSGGMMFN